jgi:prophage regulatory protein
MTTKEILSRDKQRKQVKAADRARKRDDRRPPQPVTNRLLRLKAVLEKCGLSRSALYRLMQLNQFPKSVHLSERSVGWEEGAIDAWIEQRLAAAA